MTFKEINTEGVGRFTAQQFIKSYELLKSDGNVEIEGNSVIRNNIYSDFLNFGLIGFDFKIKDIVRSVLDGALVYFIYMEIIVPKYYNPGSLDATTEISRYQVAGYAKLNMDCGNFIVRPKEGEDKIRASLNRFFKKGLLKSDRRYNLFYDNYLIQGDKLAFEHFASPETKKEMLKMKNFNLFVKGDTLIAGMIENFRVENVLALSSFFKTIDNISDVWVQNDTHS